MSAFSNPKDFFRCLENAYYAEDVQQAKDWDELDRVVFYPSNILFRRPNNISEWRDFIINVNRFFLEGVNYEEGDGGIHLVNADGREVIMCSIRWNEINFPDEDFSDVRTALEMSTRPKWMWKFAPIVRAYQIVRHFWVRRTKG